MPQTTAAKKALRVNGRKRLVNDRWRKKLRASLREMREVLSNTDAKAARAAFVKTQKMIDRAVQHKILPFRTAARKKSRLQHAIAKLG